MNYSLSNSESSLIIWCMIKEGNKHSHVDLCSDATCFARLGLGWLCPPQNWITRAAHQERIGISTLRNSCLPKGNKVKTGKGTILIHFVVWCFISPLTNSLVFDIWCFLNMLLFVACSEKTCNHHNLFNATQWDLTVPINHNSSYSILIDFGGIKVLPKGIKPHEYFVSFSSSPSQFITPLLSPLMTGHGK